MHRDAEPTTPNLPLSGWTVVNLRASDAQPAIRRAMQRYGAQSLSLPGFRLRITAEVEAVQRLRAALATATGVFVSPMAVKAVDALLPGVLADQKRALAVGAATASALRSVGVKDVIAGQPETSEGLLAQPALQRGGEQSLVLIGAPNGRGVLAPRLRERGFAVSECEVYERAAVRLDRRHWRALETASPPLALMLSSEHALRQVWAQAPAPQRELLRSAVVLASSPRLAEFARALGFASVLQAAGTRPEQHMQCLHDWLLQNVRSGNGAP
ncbi:MAG: uroporphyrinogen-III synthase [Lysobacteraceae bacterium]